MKSREEVKEMLSATPHLIAEWKQACNNNKWRLYLTPERDTRYLKIIKLAGYTKSRHNFMVLELNTPLLIKDRPIYMQQNYHEQQREMATTGRA